MKTSKRLLSALLALVLLLTPVMMTPVEAAEKSASSDHTLYVFDMEEFLKNKGYGQVPYDYLKFATALQGLANRERPQVFFYSLEGSVNTEANVDIDDVWLKYITDPSNNSNILQNGEDISKYKIERIDGTMDNFWALVTRFRSYADGLVLWDGDVGATANVASTIAGAEDLLPVRYALGRDDLYTQLMNGMGGKWTVKRSLVGLFDGKTIPTFESSNPGAEREVDTTLESTYSKKNDPYIWAIEHYLKKGKTNANLMTYSIDGSSDDFRQINPDHPIDAYIYQSNIPDVMQAGSYVPVELTVRNTGNIAWQMTNANTWPNPVRLAKVDEAPYSHSQIKNGNGTWQDWLNYHATHFQMVANDKEFDTTTTGGLTGIPANPCGGRASRLDIKNRVEVGEEYTFKFMLKAPTKPGNYQFDLRMLQDVANANFPAGVFSNVYHVSVDVIDGRVEHNESQMFDAEDSADFLCAYDAMLHTEKGKGAYDVTKNLEALQAHMVYPHADTVKIIAANVGDTVWTKDAGYAMHYSVGDFEWQTMELGADTVEVGGTATFEIPVRAADVAEDCKSAENILPAGTQLVVTAQMTKNGVPFGQMFTKTVTVKPSMAGKLVSNTIPDSISPDGKQKAALTFVNTGSFMWSGSKLDAATPGLRIAITGGARYLSDTGADNDTEATHGYNHGEIPSGYVVKPGETYTFHLDVHTYPNPLSTTDVATGKTTSNTAAGMNFIVNTQGDLAGNQQFSDNFKYTFEKYLESEIELNEVIINDDNKNGDDVSITAKDIPDVMTVNEIRKIELTLENTGTSTWYTTDHTDKAKSHQIGTDESGNPIYCWGTKNHVCTVNLMVLDETFQIYNGYTEQNEDGTLVGAWGSKKGKGYLIPGLNDYAPGQSKTVSPYIYAPSEPGVYVLRFAMTNPHTGEAFRTGYEKVIRVIEPDTERESADGKTVYLDANYRPALPREIVHLDDAKMSGVEMASKFLSVYAPQTMAAGEAAPIAITVKNVGTARWNRFRGQDASDVATNARLGVFAGGIGGNFRVTKDQAGENGWVSDQNMIELDDNFHVYPGSKTTFTSYLHAPQTPGVYTLRFQMSNAFGVSSFGEDLRIPVVVGMNAEIYYVGNFEQINNLEDSLRIGVKNMGDAAWEPLQDPATEAGYALKCTFGEETSYLSMPQTVAPGKSVDFNCMSEKPRESGEYPLTAEIIYRAEDGTEYTVGDPVETLVVIEDYHLVEQTLSTEEELAVTDNTYGVEIVSVKLPERMEPGAKMPIAITVKNTGKANLVSKYGQETGNTEGLRVYFGSQGFDSKYKEDTWQSNPTAFDVVNTTDYKLALEKKFFVFNQNGDGRTVSRYGVTINDRGNNECNCLDMKDGTTLASGDTYTYVGWIVAPYTAGSYDIRLSAEADVNKEIRSKTRTVNITVGEHDKIVVKDFLNETYPVYRTSSYSRNGLFNSALLNADYYIANQAFFFDLSPDDNIAPKDDREQPVGTDVDTLRKMFYAQMQQAQSRRSKGNLDVEGTGIFTIGGFLPWHIKYCFDSDTESTMDAFHGEFHMIDIASEYGGQTDADAYGTIGLSNASVYQHIEVNLANSPAKQTSSTFNPYTYCTEKYDPNKNYIMFYMGDYDGGAWVHNLLDAIYNEKDANGNLTRGKLPLAWQINTNLADRIPHVYNMLYKNATANDFFVAGNNGSGYFNVGWALNPRDPKVTDKQTAQIRTDWIAYNKAENQEFDLGITGFIQPTTSGRLSSEVMEVYRQTTPFGVTDCRGVYVGQRGMSHGIYDADAADGGTPFLFNVQIARPTSEENIKKCVASIRNAMLNNNGIVSASSVKATPSQIQAIVDLYNKTYPNEPLTVVDPYTFFRLYRQSQGNNPGIVKYPEIKLAARNVSFGESLRLTMAYTFDGLDISKVDMSKDAGLYVWREASEASQSRVNDYCEVIPGLQLMPGTKNVYVGQTNEYVAKDIDKYLYVRAYVKIGSRTYVSNLDYYSPQKYAVSMQGTSSELDDLVVSMLNYAAEAQTYAGDVRDADYPLSAAQRKLNFDPKSIRQPVAIDPAKNTADTAGYFARAYQNIRMSDNFSLLFFWQIDPAVYATATDSGILCWTEDQYKALKQAPSVSNAGTKLPMTSTTINGATCYGAEYTGVAARKLDQTVYTCAYMTINGVTYYSDLVNYSIHRYAQNMIARGGVMGTLAKRVVVYGDAAKAYYESK